jgi:lincosamide nucleotidyltransferase
MLHGSIPLGEADVYSDIDCIIYFKDEVIPDLDRQEWVSRIAPLLLFYKNEFGNWAAVFENFVRGEFHFYPESKIPELAGFAGVVWFPSVEAAVLVDKTGHLHKALRALVDTKPEHGQHPDLEYLSDNFCNWILFGANVFARGEHARALEILNLVHGTLLRLIRLQSDATTHWVTPTRLLEREISPESYQAFQKCTAALDQGGLGRAYEHTWELGRTLLEHLYVNFEKPPPNVLLNRLEQALKSRLNAGPND